MREGGKRGREEWGGFRGRKEWNRVKIRTMQAAIFGSGKCRLSPLPKILKIKSKRHLSTELKQSSLSKFVKSDCFEIVTNTCDSSK